MQEKPPKALVHPTPEKLASLSKGKDAENWALQLLEQHGLTLIAQNHRYHCGEIDLVMAHGTTAVIVEVRLRTNQSHGTALDSISAQKQARVTRCAKLWWVQQGQRQFTHLRFDVVAVNHQHDMQWVQNAWQLGY